MAPPFSTQGLRVAAAGVDEARFSDISKDSLGFVLATCSLQDSHQCPEQCSQPGTTDRHCAFVNTAADSALKLFRCKLLFDQLLPGPLP